MGYSAEPKYSKYVKGYGFLSFGRKFGNKYGKKLMDAAKQECMLQKLLLNELFKKLQKLLEI